MTTAAMVAGLLPLLTATGAGAASRFSIGLVVVSGMMIGTLFTLFVLPAVYVAIATNHRAERRIPAYPGDRGIRSGLEGAEDDLSRSYLLGDSGFNHRCRFRFAPCYPASAQRRQRRPHAASKKAPRGHQT